MNVSLPIENSNDPINSPIYLEKYISAKKNSNGIYSSAEVYPEPYAYIGGVGYSDTGPGLDVAMGYIKSDALNSRTSDWEPYVQIGNPNTPASSPRYKLGNSSYIVRIGSDADIELSFKILDDSGKIQVYLKTKPDKVFLFDATTKARINNVNLPIDSQNYWKGLIWEDQISGWSTKQSDLGQSRGQVAKAATAIAYNKLWNDGSPVEPDQLFYDSRSDKFSIIWNSIVITRQTLRNGKYITETIPNSVWPTQGQTNYCKSPNVNSTPLSASGAHKVSIILPKPISPKVVTLSGFTPSSLSMSAADTQVASGVLNFSVDCGNLCSEFKYNLKLPNGLTSNATVNNINGTLNGKLNTTYSCPDLTKSGIYDGSIVLTMTLPSSYSIMAPIKIICGNVQKSIRFDPISPLFSGNDGDATMDKSVRFTVISPTSDPITVAGSLTGGTGSSITVVPLPPDSGTGTGAASLIAKQDIVTSGDLNYTRGYFTNKSALNYSYKCPNFSGYHDTILSDAVLSISSSIQGLQPANFPIRIECSTPKLRINADNIVIQLLPSSNPDFWAALLGIGNDGSGVLDARLSTVELPIYLDKSLST